MNENPSAEDVQGQSTGAHKSGELLDTIRSLGDRRILLVVDRGQIQFGKFIAVQIAIFGIIGMFFFGADIKSALKEMIRANNLNDAATDTEKMQAEKLQLWTIGATLRIRFLDGTKKEQEEVKTIGSEWTKYANIRFKFVTSGVSHVRVTLRPKNFEPQWPIWGYQGTASLGIDQDKPTIGIDVANELISFGWDFSDEKVKKGSILRQFGLMLGLIDEIQNPGVPWRDKINADAINEWERRLYFPYSESELPDYRPFDAQSVMLGYVPKKFSGRDVVIGGKNYALSDGDKAIIGQLYPE